MKTTTTLRLAGTFCLLIAISACGGSDNSNGANASLIDSLGRFGVDTTPSKRIDNTGTDLPDSYSPLGSTRAITKISELYFVGLESPSDTPEQQSLFEFASGTSLTNLFTPDDNGWAKSTIRAGTAGDIDGDGKEEILLVYRSTVDSLIRLRMIDDADENFAEDEWIISDLTATALEIITGDFNGDQRADIIVGVSQDGRASLLFLTGSKTDDYSVDASLTKNIDGDVANASIVLVMKSGNIDYDASAEFAITINEYSEGFFGGRSGFDDGSVRYFVYDDASSSFAELSTGFVEDRVDNNTITTKAAGVALGDIDADGVDEIILGGLTQFTKDCESSSYLLMAIDDNAHGLTSISSVTDVTSGGGSCESSVNPRAVYFPYVNTLDIDGDQVAEIHINESVYDDFRDAPWQKIATIPRNDFGHDGGNRGFAFHKTTTALTVGDIVGDSRDDIVFRMPMLNELAVWGFAKQPDNSLVFEKKFSQSMDSFFASGPGTFNPLLIAANVDGDSFVVEYAGEVEYDFVFSEPIIIAALAAPPCGNGIAQNTDACSTAYGTSTSTTVSAEAAVTLSASGHTGVKGGFELPIIKSGVEVEYEETVTASVTAAVQGAYTVTKSETFFQDPMQDTVVITTIPYDQYTYRVVSHPNPEAIGKEFVLSVPREPRTFQVERGFYNDNVLDESSKIADSVFSHSIGDPSSYPTDSDRASLLSRFGGFEDGPRDVDLAGSRNATIDVSQEVGASTTLAVSYEKTLKVTGGNVMAGFTVGAEAAATLGFTVGSSTTYSGTVGALDPTSGAFDADNLYAWGLMAYTQDSHESGQEFQVINYWVE